MTPFALMDSCLRAAYAALERPNDLERSAKAQQGTTEESDSITGRPMVAPMLEDSRESRDENAILFRSATSIHV
jgi:hypothetical protein